MSSAQVSEKDVGGPYASKDARALNTRTYTQEITYIRKNGKESKYIVRCVKERKLMDPELKTLKQKIRPLMNEMTKEELKQLLHHIQEVRSLSTSKGLCETTQEAQPNV